MRIWNEQGTVKCGSSGGAQHKENFQAGAHRKPETEKSYQKSLTELYLPHVYIKSS